MSGRTFFDHVNSNSLKFQITVSIKIKKIIVTNNNYIFTY